MIMTTHLTRTGRTVLAVGLGMLLVLLSGVTGSGATLAPHEPLRQTVVETLLTEAVTKEGTDAAFDIRLLSPRLPMANHSQSAATLSLAIQSLDREGGRVSASLLVVFEDGRTHSVPIHAQIRAMVSLPVLQRDLARDSIIGADDIAYAEFPSNRHHDRAIADIEEIVGKVTTRRLRAQRPLHASDLAEFELIDRGQTVELIYHHAGLHLQAFGIALEPGSESDPIRVRNIDTERVVVGRIDGRGRVRLGPVPPITQHTARAER